MKKKILKLSIITIAVILIFGIIFSVLVWNGVIILNESAAKKYPVTGVDVSSYQGEIDWEILSSQNISFAFIKATEGSSFVDEHFAYNYAEARKTDLAVGAYHFFSYDSPGAAQAENFINTVAPHAGMLPPVIDVEFYGDKEKNPPAREDVSVQLKAMLTKQEEHYKRKPILYATENSYALYLKTDYGEYDIWIRNVLTKPRLSDNREWKFWQYTNRKRLKGYVGKEKYIDVNVYNGTMDDFHKYVRSGGT